jgi:chloramphenicol-sensitive protein RarD
VGHFPWLAISLAATFSFYSLVRRWVRAAPLSALTSEAAVLFLIVVFYLLTSPRDPEFFRAWQTHSWLLVLSGVITALPLLWFSYAIRGLTLTSLGMINYISPTGKFIVAVMLLGEIVTVTEVWGFGFIWFGIAVYLAYTFKRSRAQPQPE